MTVLLPLDPRTPTPALPSFLVAPANPVAHLSKAVQAIMKARRIVVICGAGISVQAGIPDFRSSDGLFHSIKRDNPKEALSSGKELFDVSVFNSEQKTSLFCQMIAQLATLSQAAQPTLFHNILRALDDRGRLLRVYTQNIDAIEQKSGLSFGVPDFESKRLKPRSKPRSVPVDHSLPADPSPSTSRLPSPPVETPRCIPLHGTLQHMHCQICNNSFRLEEYLPSLALGQPPICPECTSLEETRKLVGKRPRGIGKLRPSVVLYNEAHKDGEGVGDVVQKDLIGSSKGKARSGADLLLVVGTSLRVSGTKRMVREFAKAVRSRASSKDDSATHNGSGLATPAPSPRRSPTADEESLPKAIYLNLNFPVPTREWEGVFDTWIQGDAQEFARILHAEVEKESKAKESAVERKKKKDEDAAAALSAEHELPNFGRMLEKEKNGNVKRKHKTFLALSNKKKKFNKPLSRPYSPSSPRRLSSPSPVRKGRNIDGDENNVDDPPASKIRLRIPARPRPEVYITSPPPLPQYMKPHECVTMAHGRGHGRSITPSPPPEHAKAGRKVIRSAAAHDSCNLSPTTPPRRNHPTPSSR